MRQPSRMTTSDVITIVVAGVSLIVSVATVIASRKTAQHANSIAERVARIEQARFDREQSRDRIQEVADAMFRAVKDRASKSNSQTNLIGIGLDFESEDDRAAARLLQEFPGVASVEVEGDGCRVWVKRFPDLGDLFNERTSSRPSPLG